MLVLLSLIGPSGIGLMPFVLLPQPEDGKSERYGLDLVFKCIKELCTSKGERVETMNQLMSAFHGGFADGESVTSIEPCPPSNSGRGPRNIVDFLASEVLLDPKKQSDALAACDYASGTSYLVFSLKDVPGFTKSQRLILWRHGCVFSMEDILVVRILLDFLKLRLAMRAESPPPVTKMAHHAICAPLASSDPQHVRRIAANILDGIPDIAILCDSSGGIITFNQEAEDNFERLSDKLHPTLGSGSALFSCACHPDDVKSLYKVWGEAVREKKAIEIACRLMVKDGRHQLCQCRITPLKDEYPESPAGNSWLLVAMKIPNNSPQPSLESAASKAKSRFLAEISHEIRTPLSCVLGTATLLSLTKLDSDQEELLKTITASSQQLSNLITNVLDLGKIEENKVAIEKGPVHLEKCISEVMELFRSDFVRLRLETIVEIAPNVPSWVISDELRFKQIVTNFLSNAIKFSPPHSVVELMLVALIGKETKDIQVSVEDEGPGISEEAGRRLFQSYNQLDPSTARRYGGTGLGLRLVELLGGEIGFTSTPGKGSVFFFTIPYEEPTDVQVSYLTPKITPKALELQLIGVRHLVRNHKEVTRTMVSIRMSHPKLTAHYKRLLQRVPGLYVIGSENDSSPSENSLYLEILVSDLHEQLEAAPTPSRALIFISYDQATSSSRYGLVEHVKKPAKDCQLLDAIYRIAARMCKGINAPVSGTLPVDQEPSSLREDFATHYPLEILIAEDDELNQKLLVKILARLGYKQVEVANDGEQALNLVRSRSEGSKIHVIFMDMQMPNLDGCSASRQLRAEGYRGHIIAMTANAFTEDREECLASGMCDYASKPVKWEVLKSLLARAYAVCQDSQNGCSCKK